MPILARSLVAANAGSYSRPVPRIARLRLPDGYFHALNRGTRKATIFLDEHDYEYFRLLLERVATRHGWVCHSYCLMPNHYHLAVEAETAQLIRGMQRLNGMDTEERHKEYLIEKMDAVVSTHDLFCGVFYIWIWVDGEKQAQILSLIDKIADHFQICRHRRPKTFP